MAGLAIPGPADNREPIRLRFDGESSAAAEGTLPELRRVGTSLAEGSYRITVTIEDPSTGKTGLPLNTCRPDHVCRRNSLNDLRKAGLVLKFR